MRAAPLYLCSLVETFGEGTPYATSLAAREAYKHYDPVTKRQWRDPVPGPWVQVLARCPRAFALPITQGWWCLEVGVGAHSLFLPTPLSPPPPTRPCTFLCHPCPGLHH